MGKFWLRVNYPYAPTHPTILMTTISRFLCNGLPRMAPHCFSHHDSPIIPATGFPVRTKGTGNTELMFSQWGLVGTGNREQVSRAKRYAPQGRLRLNFLRRQPQKKIESLREQGTGNREQGTCHVPQVFPEHVPEPLQENPSLNYARLVPYPRTN